ncbi:LGFP repeat-containing protein [Nonomuraea sp. NPDC050478]|jgi:uncharacterized protein with LGFP repeats|uniref:LGFP repeat-containing protein n=1 Tax=Nonomuraea sp. NPDC050478 TaxID=3364365 RepID=UPI00379DEF46
MNRRLSLTLVAALAAAGTLTTVPAHAATGTACKIQPYGLIGARWQQLGGADGKLGCPTTGERDIHQNGVGWAGRRQTFERGQLAWSPKLGGNFVVAAWSAGGNAYVDWHRTAKEFDTFLVRYTSAADPHGVQKDTAGGFRGRYIVRARTNGGYRWNIKGCDTNLIGPSSCQKHWSVSVTG